MCCRAAEVRGRDAGAERRAAPGDGHLSLHSEQRYTADRQQTIPSQRTM